MTENKSENNDWSARIRLVVVIGLVVLGFALLCICVSRLIYPFDTGNYESFAWAGSNLLINGESPYSHSTKPPFVMAPYGVAYYFLIGVGIKLFGLQFWWGRIFSVIAALVCLWSIGRITKQITGDKLSARIAQLTFLASSPPQVWFAVQRPDMAAMAFAFLGLSLAFASAKERTTLRCCLVVLCLTAAFFVKQTTLLPIGIAALCYWARGEKTYAVSVFIATLALCFIMGVLLNTTSQGGYYWLHYTHAGKLPFSLGRVVQVLVMILKAPSTWLCVVVMLVAAYQARAYLLSFLKSLLREPFGFSFPAKWVMVIYMPLVLLFTLITTGRHGASGNYYLQTFLVGAIVCALICDWWRRNGKERWAEGFVALLILCGALFLVPVARGEYFRWQSLGYYQELTSKLDQLTPRQSVCISVYADLPVAAGRDFHFDDVQEYYEGWSPELREVWDEAIQSKRYAAIVWYSDDIQFQGYRLIRMKSQPPQKFYPLYLYLRDDLPTQ